MRMPGKGVTGVALTIVLATVAGGVLSRSLMHSSASTASATEARVLVLFNQKRAQLKLPLLSLDTRLARAAESHSSSMLSSGYFAHDGPQGSWNARVRTYVSRRVVAEILSYGSGRYTTPSGIVTSWMTSPEHRRIILMPDLRFVGLGVVTGTYRGERGVAMATADFSS